MKFLASLSLVRQTPTSMPSVHLKPRLPPVTQSELELNGILKDRGCKLRAVTKSRGRGFSQAT